MTTSSEICKLLDLQPHPEGGFFTESFKDTDTTLPRSLLSAHFKVFEIDDDRNMKHTVLGQDIAAGQKLQYVQKPWVWFGAYPTKDIEHIPEAGKPIVKSAPRDPEKHYSLVGCTVAPGFEYEDFELATRSDLLAKFPHAQNFIEFLTHAE